MEASPVPDQEGWDAVWRVQCGEAVAFVALHAVLGGHAFGGIRIQEYSSEEEALADALRLSEAMSRKVALAGICGGGGKSVLMAPDPGVRSEAVGQLGAFIQSLEGQYCCGPDLGFTPEDGVALAGETEYAACGGMAEATAQTVEISLRAALPEVRSVVVQGLGAVGRPLAQSLREKKVEVLASEIHPVEGFFVVPPETVFDAKADVFAPCALGSVLDAQTIPRLNVRVVCGAANNPFASRDDIEALHARGITYVPDVIANAGATIVGASTFLGETSRIEERLQAVGPLVEQVLQRAKTEDVSAHHVAAGLADEILDQRRVENVS